MKIMNEGNFSGLAICTLLLIGASLIYTSIDWVENYYLRALGFSIGLAAIAAAGYSGRTKALGLKIFDNAYKKAKGSYNRDIEKQ
ncbi:hypothetical protein [Collimonas sp.]|uniref:hypothetical protein n=1 Tax=Collimonas sp. TaxID=1963772 RepID=UPI002D1A04F3|nr:hypothetical protein [Collimonas sp.]HWW08182.1 hypothetical protein [Collimonas sp.]